MSTETPQTFADLRLILNGKFLDNTETLNSECTHGGSITQARLLCSAEMHGCCAGLRPSMGEIEADTVVTLHVVARPYAQAKSSGALLLLGKTSCCCCCSSAQQQQSSETACPVFLIVPAGGRLHPCCADAWALALQARVGERKGARRAALAVSADTCH